MFVEQPLVSPGSAKESFMLDIFICAFGNIQFSSYFKYKLYSRYSPSCVVNDKNREDNSLPTRPSSDIELRSTSSFLRLSESDSKHLRSNPIPNTLAGGAESVKNPKVHGNHD